jgi:hypothetical protein
LLTFNFKNNYKNPVFFISFFHSEIVVLLRKKNLSFSQKNKKTKKKNNKKKKKIIKCRVEGARKIVSFFFTIQNTILIKKKKTFDSV